MPDADPKPTPAMQRYLEVKAQNPGTILLFRIGDFYELFYDDAQTAAQVLGTPIDFRGWGVSSAMAVVSLVLGLAYFSRAERRLADVI